VLFAVIPLLSTGSSMHLSIIREQGVSSPRSCPRGSWITPSNHASNWPQSHNRIKTSSSNAATKKEKVSSQLRLRLLELAQVDHRPWPCTCSQRSLKVMNILYQRRGFDRRCFRQLRRLVHAVGDLADLNT